MSSPLSHILLAGSTLVIFIGCASLPAHTSPVAPTQFSTTHPALTPNRPLAARATSDIVLNPAPGAVCGDDGCRVAPTREPNVPVPTLAAIPLVRPVEEERALGAPDAPVTLIEYSDYQCPFCRLFALSTLPELNKQLVQTGKLRIIWRDFPLRSYPSAVRAAHAAHCAADQNMYWQMHDQLFADANQFSASHDADFALFRQMAGKVGLNVEQFMSCMESRKYLKRITEEVVNDRALDIDATPAYVLNGEVLRGLYPATTWVRMIKERLSSR